ncbi:MAG: hypothetical protein ACXVUL_23710 [Solirubrobacteraceae bacterium]
MHVSKRAAVAALTAAAFAGSSITAVGALGDRGGDHGKAEHHAKGEHRGFDEHGNFGEARLRQDGRLDVKIRGLVIPPPTGNGTPGPVTTVRAALFCGNDTAAAATTPSVPLSTSGNARIRASLTLPAKCLAPALLIQPNGSSTVYITANGFGG